MGLFSGLFKKKEVPKQPEDYYDITMTEVYVKVEHPKRDTEQINLSDITEIAVITTDEGPYLPDVWWVLTGKDTGCSLPQGAPKFNDFYDVITKFENFDFEEVVKAMGSTDNARFEVWKRN